MYLFIYELATMSVKLRFNIKIYKLGTYIMSPMDSQFIKRDKFYEHMWYRYHHSLVIGRNKFTNLNATSILDFQTDSQIRKLIT